MALPYRRQIPLGTPELFGPMMQRLRLRCGISQNQLARRAGIDPAYVNRIERLGCPPPTRTVTLRLWGALDASLEDRERLLVAAGLCPETILSLGWDAYVRGIRTRVQDALDLIDGALTPADEGGRST